MRQRDWDGNVRPAALFTKGMGIRVENLIYSLNATMPIFLLMVLGYVLHRIGWIDQAFASKMNTFVFRIALPAMLFHDMGAVELRRVWDGNYVFFCFLATLCSILIAAILSMGVIRKGKSAKSRAEIIADRGEMIQASYRSSASLLGMAFIQNIYHDSSMGAVMMVGSVPLYNIAAVVILSLTAVDAQLGGSNRVRGTAGKAESSLLAEAGIGKAAADASYSDRSKTSELDTALILQTLKKIVTNPILLGIVIGMVWSLIGLPMSGIFGTFVANVGKVATPMGLIAMGASVNLAEVSGEMKPTLAVLILKLLGFAAIFLPLASFLGFRDQKMIAVLVMLASPTTVASYVMAKGMGHRGALTQNAVMLSTVLSSFTLTFWIWLLRSFGLV